MQDLTELSLTEAAKALKDGSIKAADATKACLDRIEATEGKLGALLHVDAEEAMKLAEKMDSEGPDPARPLWGVPVTIKDALSTSTMPTTAASRILEGFNPIYDAYAVQKMREAGAIILEIGRAHV